MQMYFSPTTRGFYAEEIHGPVMPDDVRPVSDELYQSLLAGPFVVDEDGNPTPYVAPPADKRAALKAKAAERRWEVEESGVTMNGIEVATTKADQNRITSVIVNAQLAGIESVDFKAESGWITLTIDQVKGVAVAIAQHVQACFSAERAHCDAIDAAAEADLDTYDVNAGWPA
jgi:hypothetical protein